jgi:hypothetical protein
MSRGQLTFFQYALGGATARAATVGNIKRRYLYGAADEASFDTGEDGNDVGGLTIRKWYLVEEPSANELLSPDSFMLEYSGAKINGFNLTIPTDGIVTGSFDILAARESIHDYYPGGSADFDAGWVVSSDSVPVGGLIEIGATGGTSSYVSPEADRAITSMRLSSDTPFSGYVQLGGSGTPSLTPIATVQAANITLTNSAERVSVIGQRESYSIEFGRRQITGDLTVVLSDLSYYKHFLDEDDLQLRLKFDASHPGAESESIEIVLPKIRIGGEGAEAPTPTTTGTGPLSLTLPFQALRCSLTDLTAADATAGAAIPEATDIYMIVNLEDADAAPADTEFEF